MIGETSITKKCAICGEIKFIGEFSKYYPNRCKKCVAEQVRNKHALKKQKFIHDNKEITDTINASIRILYNSMGLLFRYFPNSDEIVSEIVDDYKKEITEWLNNKTKDL